MSTEQSVSLPELNETMPMDDAKAADTSDDTPRAASTTTPRTRWAAIIWGACVGVIAWSGIWMLSETDRQEAITDWLATLTPGTMTATVLLGVGVLVLISGLVGLIRRMQRGSAPAGDRALD